MISYTDLPQSIQRLLGYTIHYCSLLYLTIRYFDISYRYTKVCQFTIQPDELTPLKYNLLTTHSYIVYTQTTSETKTYYLLPSELFGEHDSIIGVPEQITDSDLTKLLECSEITEVNASEELIALQI